jgi:pimeloyl-ACP methyl ester carboxylesterase
MPPRHFRSWFALAAIWLVGCGDDGGAAATPREGLIAHGIDVGALFSSPTSAEIDAMHEAWRNDEPSVVDVRELGSSVLAGGDTVRVLSHLVGEQRHYGAVIVPEGAHAPGSLPVAVSLIGFGVKTRLEVPTDAEAFIGRYVTLLPSFRGHELRIGEDSWWSDGDAFDQCDGGSDDALAFIEAALATTPEARPSSLVVLGGSRGGNVAMIVGLRHPSVDAVIDVAGPTDYMREDLLDHPNLTHLYSNYFVRNLLDGDQDVAEARRRMLSCSPLHFAELLPPTQAHHGTEDLNVPFSQAEILAERMAELGRKPPDFELFVYEGGDHQLIDEQSLIGARIKAFIEQFE